MVLLASAPASLSQAPDPPWHHADAPVRAVFAVAAEQRHALVNLPIDLATNGIVARVAAYHGKAPRPVRVAATNQGILRLLVDCQGLSPQSLVAVYAITNRTAVAPDRSFADSQPVAVSFRKAGAFEAPPTWEEMHFMSTRPGQPQAGFPLEGLVSVASAEEGPRKWHQGGWQRPVYVATLAGRMLIPRDGTHQFAFQTPQPVYLLLDGRLILQAGRRPRHDTSWALSDPVELRAGVVDYQVLTLCRNQLRLKAGWVPPGTGTNIVDLPQEVLLTGAGDTPVRIERIGATLHAGADYELEPSYTFLGCEPRFTPVALRSLHVAWEGAQDVVCLWREGQTILGDTPLCRIVTTNSAAMAVDLEVSDNRGGRETARLRVDLPEAVGHEYRLATRLVGVPALCYEDDPVHPEIHLRGTAPDELPLTLHARVVAADGTEQTYRSEIALRQGWTRLVLPVGATHEYAAIRWGVDHAGVTVSTGGVVFQRQPFTALPDDDNGSFLVADGEALVLVPRRASSGHPVPFAGLRAGQQIVMLDGFIASERQQDAGDGADFDRQLLSDIRLFGARAPALTANGIRYRRQGVAELAARLTERTFDRLAPLTQLGRLRPADIVVVAPDMPGPDGGETLDSFERRVAGLVGLLRDTLPAQVVLMTPPPGLLPGDMLPPVPNGDDPMRPYAEAVLRVADALGITVADFYTMCRTRRATIAVEDGALTSAGRRLAAETLARTLVGGR